MIDYNGKTFDELSEAKDADEVFAALRKDLDIVALAEMTESFFEAPDVLEAFGHLPFWCSYLLGLVDTIFEHGGQPVPGLPKEGA